MAAQEHYRLGKMWVPQVGDVMRRQFISLAPEDSVREAESTMRLARVRSLPVARNGTLLGLVSYRQLVHDWMGRLLRRRGRSDPGARSIAHLVKAAPPGLSRESGLLEAAKRLASVDLGFLPVVESARVSLRLVGVVTESDLLLAAYESSIGASGLRRPRGV